MTAISKMHKVIPKDAVLIPDHATRVYKGIIYDVYTWEQKLFDDSTTTFEMLKRVDTVKAICVVDGKIIMIQEDQPNAPSRGFELPGGRVERTAHSSLEEAQREVEEETGYSFKTWRLVLVQQVSQHIEGFFHYFLAMDPIAQKDVSHDAGERIRMKLVSFTELQKQSNTEGRLQSSTVGYLAHFFKAIPDLQTLCTIPEFQGQTVDR